VGKGERVTKARVVAGNGVWVAVAVTRTPAKERHDRGNKRRGKLKVCRGVALRTSGRQEMAQKVELCATALMAADGWQRRAVATCVCAYDEVGAFYRRWESPSLHDQGKVGGQADAARAGAKPSGISQGERSYVTRACMTNDLPTRLGGLGGPGWGYSEAGTDRLSR
jgi:hypothetical protein